MSGSTLDVLREARELYAANPSHAPGDEFPEPGCYCMVTAVRPYGVAADYLVYWAALDALWVSAGTDNLVTFNAEHSTEEVLAVFDRAIAAEQAKPR